MVGFGGGSTYIALLGIFDIPSHELPLIALSCNILVVSLNIPRYRRGTVIDWSIILPLMATSIPAAFLAGKTPISESVFSKIFSVALVCTSIALILNPPRSKFRTLPYWQALIVGGLLGTISGLVGIGGGIFLAPFLYLWNVGSSKQISLYTSMFILINSLAGLMGQILKNGVISLPVDYIELLIAVLIGGLLGPTIHISWCTPEQIKRWTALLVLLVGIKMGWNGWFL
jgi:uncharacterized membrane protein YfcA